MNSSSTLNKDELISFLKREKIKEFNQVRPRPKVDLSGADLYGANLREVDLSDADLRKANLYGVDFDRADLRRADFSEANLREANLWGADLRWANLTGADLRWADIYDANLYGVKGPSENQQELILSQLKESWK